MGGGGIHLASQNYPFVFIEVQLYLCSLGLLFGMSMQFRPIVWHEWSKNDPQILMSDD